MTPPAAPQVPAFERLYRRHAADVYRYAVAVLRNQADAEDVTQTTFMNAYRAIERGESPAAPYNWLIAIAHNVCRQRFRQASRRVQEVGLEEDVADQLVRPDDDAVPGPADIRRALGHLAFNQRAALVMRELEGRSYLEIAELLGLSVGAVEALIFRARRALREQLEGALTCGQAEQMLSRQLDGELAKPDRGQLRAHLRECAACRRQARSQRAQRSALRAVGTMPLPASLASLFGGGTSVGTAIAVKAAAVVVGAGVVGGLGYDMRHALVVAPRAKQRLHPALVEAAPVTAPPRVAVPSSPVVAVVAKPARRPTAPTGHVRFGKPHGNRHAPVVVAPAPPPQQPVRPVLRTARPRSRPAVGKAHGTHPGHGPAGRQPAPRPSDRAGSPGKPPAPELTLPHVPVPLPDALTQTSQTDAARNDAIGHLHP